MGARSYIPQLGRFLQSDPIHGGSANAYAYTYGDPVNSTDLSGEYTAELSSWAMTGAQNIANEGVAAARAAREAAARAEAEQKAREAAILAERYSGDRYGNSEGSSEEGPEEEWGEEEESESGEEYASYHYGDNINHVAGHTGEGLLFEPLNEGATSAKSGSDGSSAGEYESSIPPQCLTSFESHDHLSQDCIQYVGLWKWIKKAAKTVWKAVKTVARWSAENSLNNDLGQPHFYGEPPWLRTFSELPEYTYGVPPLE